MDEWIEMDGWNDYSNPLLCLCGWGLISELMDRWYSHEVHVLHQIYLDDQ